MCDEWDESLPDCWPLIQEPNSLHINRQKNRRTEKIKDSKHFETYSKNYENAVFLCLFFFTADAPLALILLLLLTLF